MEITEYYIPKLRRQIDLKAFNKTSYLLCVGDGGETKLNISVYSKLLLEEIDGNKNIKELTQAFNSKCNILFSTDNVISIFNEQILGYGILEDDNKDKIRKKDDYLKLRFILIPYNMVKMLSKPFLPIFGTYLFTVFFLLNMLFLGISYSTQISFKTMYDAITPGMLFDFVLVNVLSIIFHEIGHATACERFGAKAGAIGFGFYFFTPVFYADVTDAWRLKRKHRLIVDLGGIYMQLVFCSVLVGIFFLNHNYSYLYISFLIASTLLANLDPFLRYDGYWALTDLLDIPNLREKSNKALGNFGGMVLGRRKFAGINLRQVFLILYALATWMFILYFMLYMVLFNNNSVLYFPKNAVLFLYNLIFNFQHIDFTWFKAQIADLTLPFFFYFFVIRILLRKKKNILSIFKF